MDSSFAVLIMEYTLAIKGMEQGGITSSMELCHFVVKPEGKKFLKIIEESLNYISQLNNLKVVIVGEIYLKECELRAMFPELDKYPEDFIPRFTQNSSYHWFVIGRYSNRVLCDLKGTRTSPDIHTENGLRSFLFYLDKLTGIDNPHYLNYVHTSDNHQMGWQAFEAISKVKEEDRLYIQSILRNDRFE